jgi:Kef-type K+ transport system membrane component KefB
MLAGTITISPDPFVAIMAASAVAGTIAAVVRFGSLAVPAVVLELGFGILIGPQGLGIKVTPPINFVADLALGLLFFFAAYELDLRRTAGTPRTVSGSTCSSEASRPG